MNPSPVCNLITLVSTVVQAQYPDVLLFIECGYKFRFFGHGTTLACRSVAVQSRRTDVGALSSSRQMRLRRPTSWAFGRTR